MPPKFQVLVTHDVTVPTQFIIIIIIIIIIILKSIPVHATTVHRAVGAQIHSFLNSARGGSK